MNVIVIYPKFYIIFWMKIMEHIAF